MQDHQANPNVNHSQASKLYHNFNSPKANRSVKGRLLLTILLLGLLVSVATQEPIRKVMAQSTSPRAPLANTFGPQRVLVLLVNFQDNTARPYTIAQANSALASASNIFYEDSYQQTSLFGDTFGWFTLPLSTTTCDVNAIRQYANDAAVASGVDISAYSRYVYIFPQNACSFTGYELDGSDIVPSVFINNSLTVRTLSHELGHTFGLFHSQALECGAASIGSSCTSISYGDNFDLMGATPSTAHLNAYQKERLGWLNWGSSPAITTVQSSGTYFIEPLETLGAGGPKALKILKSVDPVTGDKTWYYVEFRQPLGLDSSLSTNSNLMTGVLIHQGVEQVTFTGYTFLPSYLLDMTPETTSWSDPALVTGRSFQDSTAGVTITPISVGSAGTSVLVSFSSQPAQCTNVSPTVTMTPSQPAAVPSGSSVIYSVTVQNNDSNSCAAATFNLQASVPAGWSANFANSALNLGPAASSSTTLTVTSPLGANAGSYNVGVTANNSVASNYSSSALAYYSVAVAPTSLTMSVSTDRATYTSNQQVSVRSLVYAGSNPVAGVKVSFAITKPNGTLVQMSGTTGTDGSAVVKYRFSKQDPKGSYQDKASATVNGMSGSATGSFLMQ